MIEPVFSPTYASVPPAPSMFAAAMSVPTPVTSTGLANTPSTPAALSCAMKTWLFCPPLTEAKSPPASTAMEGRAVPVK